MVFSKIMFNFAPANAERNEFTRFIYAKRQQNLTKGNFAQVKLKYQKFLWQEKNSQISLTSSTI